MYNVKYKIYILLFFISYIDLFETIKSFRKKNRFIVKYNMYFFKICFLDNNTFQATSYLKEDNILFLAYFRIPNVLTTFYAKHENGMRYILVPS